MSRRTDDLSENQLMTQIQDLELQFNELKASYQLIGGSNILSFTSDTGAAYDWTNVLLQEVGAPTGTGYGVLTVTATAVTMPTLYANVLVKLFVGTSADWYRPSDAFADDIAGVQSFFMDVTDLPTTSSNTREWAIEITGDTTRQCWVKVYVVALDSVTIVVTGP